MKSKGNAEVIKTITSDEAEGFVRAATARAIPLIVDTETDGLEVASGRHVAHYLGLTPAVSPRFCAVVRAPFSAGLRDALNRAFLVGHNARFDCHALGLDPATPPYDTMLRIYAHDTSARKSLDDVGPRLGLRKLPTPALIAKGRIAEVPPEEVAEYLADDCAVTAELYRQQAKHELTPTNGADFATELAVARMERRGVRLLREPLRALAAAVDEEIARTGAALAACGFDGNLNSPAQVKAWFERRGVALPKDRKTGKPSTGKISMEVLERAGDPSAAALTEARKALKLRDAFIVPLTEGPDLIHANVKTAHTKTGRFSYERPNLQQVPKRGPLAVRFRSCFTSASGRVAGADYSQVEMRVAAALSGDPGLLEAFASGGDLHATIAAQMLGKSLESVTKDERFRAKAVNFGILNGMAAGRLAHEIKASRAEAQQFLDRYLRRFDRLHTWMEGIWRECEQSRMAHTVGGRRRIFGRDEETRPGISVVVQGSAADLMRAALRALDSAGKAPILAVHDEIIVDAADLTDGQEVATITQCAADDFWKRMTGSLPVSFEAMGGEGETWGSC